MPSFTVSLVCDGNILAQLTEGDVSVTEASWEAQTIQAFIVSNHNKAGLPLAIEVWSSGQQVRGNGV